jgi:hypothetical protein
MEFTALFLAVAIVMLAAWWGTRALALALFAVTFVACVAIQPSASPLPDTLSPGLGRGSFPLGREGPIDILALDGSHCAVEPPSYCPPHLCNKRARFSAHTEHTGSA